MAKEINPLLLQVRLPRVFLRSGTGIGSTYQILDEW